MEIPVCLPVALCALLAAPGCEGCRRPAAQPAATDGASGAAASAPAAPDPSSTLLGGERGLDHVGIAVKSLERAVHTYHDTLGFSRPIEGKLPNGIRNVNYYFADATYLETLAYWDRARAAWLADFTDAHSGALFAVLSVRSPEATTAFLARRGIQAGPPFSGTIQTAGEDAMPDEKWKTFFLPDATLPGNPLYFISYARAPRDAWLHELDDPRARRRLLHRNTALGLRAVWLAVPGLEAASEAYASLGLPRGRSFEDGALGARGQVFAAGSGELWLMAPASADSKIAGFLRERHGAGIIGVTLAAGSIATAKSAIEEGTGSAMPTYPGQLGLSIRVPPDLAEGVWIELSQQP